MRKNNNLTSPPRERVSVAIQGIDRSTPDDLCKDGTCEELHNLRYKDSAWRPVSAYAEKQFGQAFPLRYKVVYKHPASPEDKYIVENAQKNVSMARYYYYEVSTNDTSMSQATLIAKFDEKQKVSHFGNVLMFSGENSSLHFLLKKGEYKPFIIPPYARTSISSSSIRSLDPAEVRPDLRRSEFGFSWKEYSRENLAGTNTAWNFYGTWFPIHNITNDYSCIESKDDHWNGELLLFTTWRMADGTNLSPSPLHLLKSYEGANDLPYGYNRSIKIAPSPRDLFIARSTGQETSTLDKYLAITIEANNLATEDTYAPQSEQFTRAWLPNLRIDIPLDADLSSVTHLAIWANRIHPIFSVTQNYESGIGRNDNFSTPSEIISPDGSFSSFYDKTDLTEQPFYLVKEIPVEDILIADNERHVDIVLSSSLLSNITTNTRYEPNNNIHAIFASATLDFNMRHHLADATTILADSYDLGDGYETEENLFEQRDYTTIEVDNALFGVMSTSLRSASGFSKKSPYTHVLTYPDFRAKSVKIDGVGVFSLKPSASINVAWYHAPHTENEKYPPIPHTPKSVVLPDYDIDNRIIRQPNRLQVSSANNPFSFLFDNSYNIGSIYNRIIALQSAAIEMSDAKFGEFPLFAFTEEGIFVLQAGSTTLYASIIPINYDKIINPNTLAINGGIIYITERGVHLLSARGDKLTSEASTLISSPIHDKDGRPPLDFLRTCQIMWPKQHNEVIFHNPDNGGEVAYVYNLDAGYWSTRSLKGTKLNTDEMVDGNTIYNLADETALLYSNIVTRPIKLGNVEFKRLETIIPRMSGTDNVKGAIYIDGAVKPSEYMSLRTIVAPWDNPLIIRRTPFSAKYFKATLSLPQSSPSFSITHIDFEWYRKFQHRMR